MRPLPHSTHPIDYYQPQRLKAVINSQEIHYFSKPGVPSWEHVTPASHLLAKTIDLPAMLTGPGEHVLLLGDNLAALGVVLARQLGQGQLWLSSTNQIAIQMASSTMLLNGISNVQFIDSPSLHPALTKAFRVVIMELPKGRKLAQRWLLAAHALLDDGGLLFLAGATGAGIQPLLRDAEDLFGNIKLLGYKKGSRLGRAAKLHDSIPALAWVSEPGVALGTWFEFESDLGGVHLRFRSLPGVFSYNRIDEGTKVLLSNLQLPAGSRVLDFGCGYGPIGLTLAKRAMQSYPDPVSMRVDLIDSNQYAVASARENIALNEISNARAFPSDILASIEKAEYTHILSNPPFHTGTEVDYQVAEAFIAGSWDCLIPGGQLILVANKFIRYDRLMARVFSNVHTITETGKYHLLAATR